MKITVKEVYGSPRSPTTFQVRGTFDEDFNMLCGKPLAYNVQLFAGRPLSIPRLLLVRRSSWTANYGDGGSLPF